MTAQELIADLRLLGPQDSRVFFSYLADHFHEARLANQQRLCDLSDVIAFLREVAAAADGCEFPESAEVSARGIFGTRPKVIHRIAQPRNWSDFCPDCGHAHIEDDECGFPIGGGRICRCERKVTA
jgi:hypothetical protein